MNKVEGHRRLTYVFSGAGSVVIMWMMVTSAYGAFPNLDPSVIAGIALAIELIFTLSELRKRRSNRVVIVMQMFFATWVVLLVAEHQRNMMFSDVIPPIATAVLGAALVALAWTVLYVFDGFRQSTSPGV